MSLKLINSICWKVAWAYMHKHSVHLFFLFGAALIQLLHCFLDQQSTLDQWRDIDLQLIIPMNAQFSAIWASYEQYICCNCLLSPVNGNAAISSAVAHVLIHWFCVFGCWMEGWFIAHVWDTSRHRDLISSHYLLDLTLAFSCNVGFTVTLVATSTLGAFASHVFYASTDAVSLFVLKSENFQSRKVQL